MTKTPELAKAAKISLDARGIAGDSDVREWSFAWRTALYARLHDGENSYISEREFQLFVEPDAFARRAGWFHTFAAMMAPCSVKA